jgi:hypothetical protein
MNWKRRRQNAEERFRQSFLDPLPKPEDEPEAEVYVKADMPEPASPQERQQPTRNLLPYQRPGWFPPFLTEKRKRRIDAQDRIVRRQLSPSFSATGD